MAVLRIQGMVFLATPYGDTSTEWVKVTWRNCAECVRIVELNLCDHLGDILDGTRHGDATLQISKL